MDMLINLIVVIVSQCTYILNHQVVHFKYIHYICQYLNEAEKMVTEKFQQFEVPSS